MGRNKRIKATQGCLNRYLTSWFWTDILLDLSTWTNVRTSALITTAVYSYPPHDEELFEANPQHNASAFPCECRPLLSTVDWSSNLHNPLQYCGPVLWAEPMWTTVHMRHTTLHQLCSPHCKDSGLNVMSIGTFSNGDISGLMHTSLAAV